MVSEPHEEGAVVRVLGTVAAPFVVVWDGMLRGIEAFFGAAERLDPIALFERLFDRIGPFVRRVAMRINEMTARYWAMLARIFRAPVEWLSRGMSWLTALGRRALAPAQRFFAAVLRSTIPIRERMREAWHSARSAMGRVLDPARRLRESIVATARQILRRPKR